MYYNNEPVTSLPPFYRTTTTPGITDSTNFYGFAERRDNNSTSGGYSKKDLAALTNTPPSSALHNTTTDTSSGSNSIRVSTDLSNKRPTIIVYPTVAPESIVIPIVSCIFGFPLLALLVICCLRRRAKLARERDRRRNYDLQDHAVSLVRFSPIHRLTGRASRTISLRSERSMSRGFPSLELDTVIEERSDPEQTQIDLMTPDSPIHPSNEHLSFDSNS